MSADEAIIINCETSPEIRFSNQSLPSFYGDREPLGIKTLSDLIVKSDAVILRITMVSKPKTRSTIPRKLIFYGLSYFDIT